MRSFVATNSSKKLDKGVSAVRRCFRLPNRSVAPVSAFAVKSKSTVNFNKRNDGSVLIIDI
jgi:hypothetical protein